MQPDELKRLRKGMGLTQGEMAARLGLSHGYIGEMERGEKPIERRTIQAARYVQLKQLIDKGKVRFRAGTEDTTDEVLAAMRAAVEE